MLCGIGDGNVNENFRRRACLVIMCRANSWVDRFVRIFEGIGREGIEVDGKN